MAAVIAALAVVEAAALLLATRIFVSVCAELMTAHQKAHAEWRAERRELLERIQRPERVPLAPALAFETPDFEPDEMELVGTITYEPED